MTKLKNDKAPHYEMLYIISNKYSEDELKPIISNVEKVITDNTGKITYREDWGKKKFAYPIEHFQHGYYQLMEFDIAGEKIGKINQAYRMSNEILRHMVVFKPAKSVAEIEEEKKQARDRIERDKAKVEEIPEKEITAPKDSPDKKKVDLKDLDEKLDKILETDDLL
jgi:small subunit ribosomal protein S6